MKNYTKRNQTLEPQNVVYYRHKGEYDKMGPSINKLMQWAYPRGDS